MAEPTGVVQLASDAVAGLKSTPGLLMLVILNGCFCAAGAWFLIAQENYRHVERMELAALLNRCVTPTRSGP